jgi:pentose-5-phosphate-3-epimerase
VEINYALPVLGVSEVVSTTNLLEVITVDPGNYERKFMRRKFNGKYEEK